MSLNWAKKDLTKKRFGRLLVISESKKRYSNGLVLWDCVCDCGKKKTVNGASLRSGKSKSCGCLMLDTVRLPKGEASFNKLFGAYKLGAKNRGHKFELSKEDFKSIVVSDCFYCGDKPSQEMKNNGKSNFFGNFTYNGIDRVNNKNGYVLNNVVPCCFRCNQAKLTMGKYDFIKMIKKIYEHLQL